ncbi:hypothetical protein [Stenotrophomonas indicatrix]|uniref:hypothetical protein n=1 Tax=Stenotrophomonas indicatrix TaxID=2045451 RepID=UPI00216568A2|nr:hypothetical protein [Stenotrophomonas indicatrix]
MEAITEGRIFDQELDAPRFKRAFAILCRDCRQWPLPSSLLEAMPPREQLAITKQPIKANPERAERAAQELASLLGSRR